MFCHMDEVWFSIQIHYYWVKFCQRINHPIELCFGIIFVLNVRRIALSSRMHLVWRGQHKFSFKSWCQALVRSSTPKDIDQPNPTKTYLDRFCQHLAEMRLFFITICLVLSVSAGYHGFNHKKKFSREYLPFVGTSRHRRHYKSSAVTQSNSHGLLGLSRFATGGSLSLSSSYSVVSPTKTSEYTRTNTPVIGDSLSHYRVAEGKTAKNFFLLHKLEVFDMSPICL